MSYIKINDLKKKSYLIIQDKISFCDCTFRKGTIIEILQVNEFAYNKCIYVNIRYKNKFFTIELKKLAKHKIFIEGNQLPTY